MGTDTLDCSLKTTPTTDYDIPCPEENAMFIPESNTTVGSLHELLYRSTLLCTRYYIEAARIRRFVETQRILKTVKLARDQRKRDREEAKAATAAAAAAAAQMAAAAKERSAANRGGGSAGLGAGAGAGAFGRSTWFSGDGGADNLGDIGYGSLLMPGPGWGLLAETDTYPSDDDGPSGRTGDKPGAKARVEDEEEEEDRTPFVDSDGEFEADMAACGDPKGTPRAVLFRKDVLEHAELLGVPTANNLDPLTFLLPRAEELPNFGEHQTALWEDSRARAAKNRKLTLHAFLRHPEIPQDTVHVDTMSHQDALELRQNLHEAEAPFLASFKRFKAYLANEEIACASTGSDFCLLCNTSFTTLSPTAFTSPIMVDLMTTAAKTFTAAMELLGSTHNNISQVEKAKTVARMFNSDVVPNMDQDPEGLFSRILHFNNQDPRRLFCTAKEAYVHGTRHMTKQVCIDTIEQSMVNGLADIWISVRREIEMKNLKSKETLALIATVISLVNRLKAGAGSPPGPVSGSKIMSKTGANASCGANGNGVTAGIRKGAQGKGKS